VKRRTWLWFLAGAAVVTLAYGLLPVTLWK
jgi:hypothetical protein